jgi:hypothetical protein
MSAATERVALIERVVTDRLSAAGIDLLFDAADVLSEGDGAGVAPGGVYYGSTMLTVALDQLATRLAEAPTHDAVERLRELFAADPRVRRRLVDLVRLEASRQCGGRALDACDLDVSLRAEGLRLLVDVDVEARLAVGQDRSAA